MTAKTSRIYSEQPVSADVARITSEFDTALRQAIDSARQAGIPQGIMVALLHGHAHSETTRMVS